MVDKVRGALAELQAGLPGGMDLVWVSDQGAFVQASVASTR